MIMLGTGKRDGLRYIKAEEVMECIGGKAMGLLTELLFKDSGGGNIKLLLIKSRKMEYSKQSKGDKKGDPLPQETCLERV